MKTWNIALLTANDTRVAIMEFEGTLDEAIEAGQRWANSPDFYEGAIANIEIWEEKEGE